MRYVVDQKTQEDKILNLRQGRNCEGNEKDWRAALGKKQSACKREEFHRLSGEGWPKKKSRLKREARGRAEEDAGEGR